jgi:hypothetical protein
MDGELVKELIGKKLRAKLRKELDEIGDRLQIKFKSCRRQVSRTLIAIGLICN